VTTFGRISDRTQEDIQEQLGLLSLKLPCVILWNAILELKISQLLM